eukprot:TRINITY_DN2437_c0_g10_i2.p1 TRINITY_DN2437_c0_g10~~TRINITY_DN2437_c0_g10_i2.p1  ORF type:complete len:360 (-),score=108.70 TRINITY_DN2437_c0_g10_i2:1087-2166(-)
MSSKEELNAYEILGFEWSITSTIPIEEIHQAYRAKARTEHPDKSKRPDAAERFLAIKKAYDILSDAKARSALDEFLKAKVFRKQRHQQMDDKRREMKEKLLAREKEAREARKAASEKSQQQQTQEDEDDQIRLNLERELARLRRERWNNLDKSTPPYPSTPSTSSTPSTPPTPSTPSTPPTSSSSSTTRSSSGNRYHPYQTTDQPTSSSSGSTRSTTSVGSSSGSGSGSSSSRASSGINAEYGVYSLNQGMLVKLSSLRSHSSALISSYPRWCSFVSKSPLACPNLLISNYFPRLSYPHAPVLSLSPTRSYSSSGQHQASTNSPRVTTDYLTEPETRTQQMLGIVGLVLLLTALIRSSS